MTCSMAGALAFMVFPHAGGLGRAAGHALFAACSAARPAGHLPAPGFLA